MTFEEAKKAFDEASAEYNNHWRIGLDKPSFDEMVQYLRPYGNKRADAYVALLNLVENPEVHEFPDYGDRFTLEEYISSCSNEHGAGFIDNDGSGYLCTDKGETEYSFPPSIARRKDLHLNKIFTAVMWFNK